MLRSIRPMRARRPSDASVDPTDARSVAGFGPDDRGPPRVTWTLHSVSSPGHQLLLTTVVRIQTERGHKVISTGPYAVVRHPLYAAALLVFFSSALLLGSWYGLAASLVLAGAVVFRTVLKDRELRRGLQGYTDYAARVRYRLIPLVW